MRKLEFQDVFTVGRIIEKSKLKEDIIRAYKEGKKEDAPLEDIGMDSMFALLSDVVKEGVEQEIYDLLGSITETDADAVRHQTLPEIFGQLKQIAKENDLENFFGFLKAVMK